MWSRRSLRYYDGGIHAPGGGSPEGVPRIILLVHGYNNDKAEAEQSYEALVHDLPDDAARLGDQVWKFFWPSYVERSTGRSVDEPVDLSDRYASAGSERHGLLSAPTYAWQVLKARDVGRELGRYLRGLEREDGLPTEVVFVAHSLGCRVVLEALRELLVLSTPDAERHRVPCVYLMAAAVPTFMVGAGARLEDAATLPQATYVLHSRADFVLRAAFPPGQGAATALLHLGLYPTLEDDDEGYAPEAVGRDANPREVWLRHAETRLGHSDYWTHPSTAPNVLRALGGSGVSELREFETLEGIAWRLPVYPDLPDWKNRDLPMGAGPTRRPLG